MELPGTKMDQCDTDEARMSVERAKKASHWRLAALIGANYSQLDMEIVLLYFTLIKSDAACEYLPKYTMMKTIQFGALIAWRPLSGWITDVTSEYADWVLFVTTVLEFVTLVGMVVVGLLFEDFSVWLLLGTQLFKNLVETQQYNSTWKVFKMRLDLRFGVGCGMQCGILTKIGLLGEFAELVYILFVCAGGYWLMEVKQVPFNFAMLWFFSGSMLASIICVAVAWMVVKDKSYFEPVVETFDATAWQEEYGDDVAADKPLLVPHSTVSDAEARSSRSTSSVKSIRPAQARALSTPWTVAPTGAAKSVGLCDYLADSWRAVFGNEVARRAITHSVLIFIPMAIMGSAEQLELPLSNAHMGNATRANYCGGLVVNVAYQDIWVNVSYIVIISLYYHGIRRLTPHTFYGVVFPVCGLLMTAASLMLLRGVPPIAEYITNSLITAGAWFFFMYSGFLATAAIPHKYYGFYATISGYIQTLSYLSVYLLMTIKLKNSLFVYAAAAMTVAAVSYSLYFGCAKRRSLVVAGKGYCD